VDERLSGYSVHCRKNPPPALVGGVPSVRREMFIDAKRNVAPSVRRAMSKRTDNMSLLTGVCRKKIISTMKKSWTHQTE